MRHFCMMIHLGVLVRRKKKDKVQTQFDFSYGLLIVHPGTILVNNQLDAQFFLVCLFLFSTCFGQLCAHHQDNYCINATPGLCHSV